MPHDQITERNSRIILTDILEEVYVNTRQLNIMNVIFLLPFPSGGFHVLGQPFWHQIWP